MKWPTHIFVMVLAVALVGCASKEGNLASGSDSKGGSAAAAGPDILGKWKGDIKMPETNKDDPMAKMGEAMAQMFLGNLTLEFMAGDKFKLTMMGMPIEGNVKRAGNELTMTPETALGMPIEEARKTNPNLKDEPLKGTISAAGDEIVLKGDDDKATDGQMVFKRAKDEPAKEVKSTVSEAEKAFVGDYGAEMVGTAPANQTDDQKNEWKMAEMMVKSASLNLLADNTFKMTMVFDLEGTWKADGGNLTLKMTKALGMDGGKPSADNEDLKLRSESGGKLISDQPGPGGAKLVFVKK